MAILTPSGTRGRWFIEGQSGFRDSDDTFDAYSGGNYVHNPVEMSANEWVEMKSTMLRLFDSYAQGWGLVRCRNESGGTLSAGTLVYVSGYDAAEDRALVSKAQASVNRARYIIVDDILDQANGAAYAAFAISGLDTSGASAVGDPVYLSSTVAGSFQHTAPADSQEVGRIVSIDALDGKVVFSMSYTGMSGFSGFAGTVGSSGVSGATGAVGSSGTSGAVGISGTNGTDGGSGTSGFSGATGPSGGDSGTSGASGYSSPSGASGVSGFSSATGFSGVSGFSGQGGGVVSCRYTTTVAQSLGSGADSTINYGTLDFDTHSAVATGGSWAFTSPVDGKYLMIASVELAPTSNFDFGDQLQLKITKNGATISSFRLDMQESQISTWIPMATVSAILNLSAGNTISAVLYHTSDSTEALSTSANGNWIAIHQLS